MSDWFDPRKTKQQIMAQVAAARHAEQAAIAISQADRQHHRAVKAHVRVGRWLSAALDDPNVCEEMKADIREWFSAGEPFEPFVDDMLAAPPRQRDQQPDALGAGDGE